MIRKSLELKYFICIFIPNRVESYYAPKNYTMLEKGLKCRLRGPYDPHENCRPIRAQDSGSHGSKGPLTTPNRLTRSLDTRRIDKETHGGLPEQGGRLGPPGSRPTTKHPRPSPLIRSFLTPSLRRFHVPALVKLSARHPLSSPYKYERGVRIGQEQASTLLQFLS